MSRALNPCILSTKDPLPPGGLTDPLMSNLVQRMLQLLTERPACLPHRLCTLSSDARRAGDPYATLVQLGR